MGALRSFFMKEITSPHIYICTKGFEGFGKCYLVSKVECPPYEDPEREAHQVIAPYVHIRSQCLPTRTNCYAWETFIFIFI